ncbi:MAG: GNVR domain-containing protein, partial [Thermus sp.]
GTTLAQDRAELEALTGERSDYASRIEIALEPRLGERILLDRELSKIERDLAAIRGKIRFLEQELKGLSTSSSSGQLGQLPQRLENLLVDARAEEAQLFARKAALQARMAQVEARINLLKERVAKAQVEQDRINQTLEMAKNAYLALSQKRTDLQIELASSQNSLAQIIAPAYPIYEKVAPKRALILALAVFLGLVLGVMAAFVAEALKPPRPEAAAG